jgi:Flp pilus assembly protein TadB
MAAGERAKRRAERERLAAEAAEARRVEAERQARRAARRTALTRWLPRARPGQSGRLAEKRRQQTVLVVAGVVALNFLLWLGTSDWAARALFLLLSLLVTPIVVHLATKK